MAYGSKMADGLEAEEFSGDPLLDLVMSRLPKFEIMDQPIIDPKGVEVWYERDQRKVFVPVLKDGKDSIPLLAVPDSATTDYKGLKEYKTSVRKWTQKMVDESGQVTFYATAVWLAKGYIPEDIELVNAQTDYNEDGSVGVTGNIFRMPTKRTMVDIIKMTARIKRSWAGIKELCEKELL